MSEEINKLIESLKDNIPVDYTRSCDSSDGIGHYDEDSWQYQLYNYITNLQQENQQLKEQLEKKYKEVGTLTNEILYEENTKLLSVLDEIREYINTTEVSDDIGGILLLKECMYFDDLLQILDKVGKE